jgi:hypothetical protein
MTSKTRNSRNCIGTGLENSLGYLPWHMAKDRLWEQQRVLGYLLKNLLKTLL